MMQHVEDLRCLVGPTLRMGEAEKKAAREALVAGPCPRGRKPRKRTFPATRSSAARN